MTSHPLHLTKKDDTIISRQEEEKHILGLLVCQDELKDADTCPSFTLPVIRGRVQLLQSIKRFGSVVELAHLKQYIQPKYPNYMLKMKIK